MEATNQEVITLESNLPRLRHGRCRGARRAARQRRAERWQREPGRRAAGKLGTRGGRVARCAPAAEEPGSECGCCLSAAPATLSGRRGRSARGRGRRAPRWTLAAPAPFFSDRVHGPTTSAWTGQPGPCPVDRYPPKKMPDPPHLVQPRSNGSGRVTRRGAARGAASPGRPPPLPHHLGGSEEVGSCPFPRGWVFFFFLGGKWEGHGISCVPQTWRVGVSEEEANFCKQWMRRSGAAGGSLGPREVSARNCPRTPSPPKPPTVAEAPRRGQNGRDWQASCSNLLAEMFQMRTLISGGGTQGSRWTNGDWAGVKLTMYAWNWREEECKHGSGRGVGDVQRHCCSGRART